MRLAVLQEACAPGGGLRARPGTMTECVREHDYLDPGAYAEYGKDPAAVALQRRLGQDELGADLFVRQATAVRRGARIDAHSADREQDPPPRSTSGPRCRRLDGEHSVTPGSVTDIGHPQGFALQRDAHELEGVVRGQHRSDGTRVQVEPGQRSCT